jgi:hypothetical protein
MTKIDKLPNEVPKLLADVKITNLNERGIKFDYIDNTKIN